MQPNQGPRRQYLILLLVMGLFLLPGLLSPQNSNTEINNDLRYSMIQDLINIVEGLNHENEALIQQLNSIASAQHKNESSAYSELMEKININSAKVKSQIVQLNLSHQY